MIHSLTTRIFAIFWLTMALVLMLVLMVPKLDSRKLSPLTEEEKQHGMMLASHMETTLNTSYILPLPQWKRLFDTINQWTPPGQHLILLTNDGRLFGNALQGITLKQLRNFVGISDSVDHPLKKKYDRNELLGPFYVRDGDEFYLLYQIRPALVLQSDFISLLFDRPLLLLLVTMLVSTPLLLWLAWSLAKPARKLQYAADTVARGNLQQHPELESGPQEFLAAGSSFNQMIRALENMVTTQHRLLSDISHELRTPLTRLQLATAILRRRLGEGNELNRIETEAQRLDIMINDLLALSRTQYRNELIRETIKANKLWTEILDNARFEAEQKGKQLTIRHKPEGWPLYCNPNALQKALENVIRNALRYSARQIEVDFQASQNTLTITVDDDGPGVSPDEREQIFRPFYRTSEARDRESGGTGLGLAIVETAILQHNGKVAAHDSPLGGLRLVITLPLHGH